MLRYVTLPSLACGRHGDLVVRTLHSRSSGPGVNSGRGTLRHVIWRGTLLEEFVFTQVYKWILVNLILGVALQWTSIQSRGNRNVLSSFILRKPDISADRMCHCA